MSLHRSFLLALFLLFLPFGSVAAAETSRFFIEAELWIGGEQVGTPSLVVPANSPASVEVGDEDSTWRLGFMVEPVTDAHAPADTLWMHVEVHQKMDGQWESVADSLLGVPEGEDATFSVVEGQQAATAESASLYLQISARSSGQGS